MNSHETSAAGIVFTWRAPRGHGLGTQVYRWGDTTAVGHSGNLAGYTALVLYDPTLKFGVVVLRSAAGGEASAGRLAGRMFRMVRRRTGPAGQGT